MSVVIVLIPDHCLSIYFANVTITTLLFELERLNHTRNDSQIMYTGVPNIIRFT